MVCDSPLVGVFGVFAGVKKVAGEVTPSVIVIFLLFSLNVLAVECHFCGPPFGCPYPLTYDIVLPMFIIPLFPWSYYPSYDLFWIWLLPPRVSLRDRALLWVLACCYYLDICVDLIPWDVFERDVTSLLIIRGVISFYIFMLRNSPITSAGMGFRSRWPKSLGAM